MAYDGSGTYSLPSPEYPAVPDTVIDSTDYNTILEDLADALTSAILRNGVAAFTGNQSMGGFKLTNLADAVSDGDAPPLSQVNALITAAEFNTALPSQSASTVGKTVKSDGTNASWDYNRLTRDTRTSNTQLAAADCENFVDVTTGGFTQTFAAAAALGAGWWCVYRNNSTADVTLDPNSTETIDGLTSYVMYPGEARIIQCDGSNFYTVLLTGFIKTFLSSGTFTKPPGYANFDVFVQGPGGGGGSGRKTSTGVASGGGGAGAGAWVRDVVPAAAVSSTETVTVGTGGAGGAGQTSNDTNGNNGSNGSGPSSFGTLLSAAAGNRGDAGSTVGGGGGAGGTCAGAIAIAGTAGGAASASGANTGTAATTTQGATGGGGGGGYDGGAAYAPAAGGASGTSSSASQLAGGTAGTTGATGTAGSAGNSSNMLRGGTGGGGGGYGSSGNGGAGGAGVRGGGGGGGGACSNTGTSGAGGVGGDGYVWVRGIV